jgi:hypothetical protein
MSHTAAMLANAGLFLALLPIAIHCVNRGDDDE